MGSGATGRSFVIGCDLVSSSINTQHCLALWAVISAARETLLNLCCGDDTDFLSTTTERISREDVRGAAEETGPPTRRAVCYSAHSSTNAASTLSSDRRGFSQPQQEEEEFRSG